MDNSSQHQFSSPQCDNHRHHAPCPRNNRYNSEESEDARNFPAPKCLSRISRKPAPINLSSCSCHSCNVETPDTVYPSPCGYVNASGPAEIMPGLFLGCAKDAASAETLRKYNITYILNVTPNLPNVFEDNKTFKYKQIPITDHWSQNLSQFFPEAISFIGKFINLRCSLKRIQYVFSKFNCLAITYMGLAAILNLMNALRYELLAIKTKENSCKEVDDFKMGSVSLLSTVA